MAYEWPVVAVSDLASPESGGIAIGPFGSRMKSDCYVPDGVRVVRGNNLTGGRKFNEDFVFVTLEKARSLGSSLLKPNDLVFPHRGSIGEVGIVPSDGRPYVMSTSLMKLTCDLRKANPIFLYYFFKSQGGRDALLANKSQVGTPGIGQPLTSLKSIRLPLPPLSDQGQIVGILSALDDKIENLRQSSSTTEAIAQAFFRSWFVDFEPVRAKAEGGEPEGMDAATAALFPEAIDSSTGLPAGWVYKELRELAAANRRTMSKGYPHAAIQYVDISSVEPGRIQSTKAYALADSPSRAKRLVQDGDVIWSCVRPNRRSFALVIDPEPNLVCSTGFVTLSAESVPFSYLYMSVTSNGFVDYLTQRADGAAYPAVRPGVFEDAELIVPSETIAARFNEIVEPMLRAVARNQMIAKTFAELRDTLLPRLISGKLRVPDAEKLMEAVL